MIGSNMKRVIALIAASAAAVSLAACGSNSSQDSKTIEFWDPYPQKNDSSTWAKYVTNCAPEGYNVKRIGYAQSDLLNNLTTAVKAGNAPQIALIDNPKMPTAVDAGLVTDIEAAGVDVSGFDKNIEGPGIIDGVQYGVSYGTNALGLYYNPDVLNKAGVDPESITDWDSLNSAIEKVVNAGYKGITFSGISGEEGTFQFLPWFWGAGGQLKDASGCSAEQDALDLVTDQSRYENEIIDKPASREECKELLNTDQSAIAFRYERASGQHEGQHFIVFTDDSLLRLLKRVGMTKELYGPFKERALKAGVMVMKSASARFGSLSLNGFWFYDQKF